MSKFHLSYDARVYSLSLLAGLPGVLVSMGILWFGDYTPKVQWTLTLLILGCWLGFSAVLRIRIIRPLQTMANLLAALREGDFSIRARGARRDESLGELISEINALSTVLQEQRRGAIEASALLRAVMAEIDVAIFAFDDAGLLRLVNRSGEMLLAQSAERLLGRAAAEIGLGEALESESERVLATTSFPGGSGRWGMRRTTFREGGRPHSLLVIADLSQALREEELKAWQRLVRVLGHELNNSLAPIKSIAGSLDVLLKREPRADDWENDMRTGLEIIATRADGLARFMEAYARLARIPAPTLALHDLSSLLSRVLALERRLPVQLFNGPAVSLQCDAAQIEQALINLLQNAVDAALEQRAAGRSDAGVRLRWKRHDEELELMVEDDGPGIAQATGLFVPFFTTKTHGSGIGLVLSRQIAENHGGSLTLVNRTDGTGCIATLCLPLSGR